MNNNSNSNGSAPSSPLSAQQDDPAWTKLCDQLSRSLRAVGKHNQLLQRAKERLVERQSRDIGNAKSKLREIMEGSNKDVALVHDTLSSLAKYMRLHPATHKGPVQRMAAEAQLVIKEYEEGHRRLLQAIQSLEHKGGGGGGASAGAGAVAPPVANSIPTNSSDTNAILDSSNNSESHHPDGGGGDKYARFRPSSYGAGSSGTKKQPLSKRFAAAAQAARDEDDEEDDGDDTTGLLGGSQHQQQQQQQLQQDDFDQQLHNEIMEERKKDVVEIAENLADIKDIFEHINLLVGEQGEKLDLVEENTETTVVNMERGNEELVAARRQVKSSNKRSVYFILAAFILLLVFLGLIMKFT